MEPTFDGLDTLPGPVEKATIFKKYGTTVSPAFGDLSAGGMQPITGPIYRSSSTSGAGAFPAYYDGSWLINNRGSNDGFWKEVQLRKDNNEMLRVNEWLPYNGGVNPSGANSSLVIGTQFGPDGNLYMSRYQVGCCRSGTSENDKNQIVKISFNVLDQCDTDTAAPNASADVTGQAYPDTPNTYVNTAKLRLSATDSGCAGVKNLEYRQAGTTEWSPYSAEVTFDEGKTYNIEYRATDRKDNVSAVKTTTFTVLKINDTTAPTATAATSGNKDQRDNFVGSATLTLSATDDATGSGVQSIEYRTNGGAWTTYTTAVAFNAAGSYTVDYRATDKVNNTSVPKQVTFRVLSGAGCTQTRSDEFNGTTLGSQWVRHTRNGGTPTTGDKALSLSEGVLNLPTGDFEIDAANAQTSVGPVNFIGQDLAGTRHGLDRGDAVHGAVHRRLAERRTDRLERGQQLLPLLADAQPQRRCDLHGAVEGQPDLDRRRASAVGQHAGPGEQHGPGHDPDAVRACREQRHRHLAVPDHRAGFGRHAGLGELPDHHREPEPQPLGRGAS